jgi:hypothetical protein
MSSYVKLCHVMSGYVMSSYVKLSSCICLGQSLVRWVDLRMNYHLKITTFDHLQKDHKLCSFSSVLVYNRELFGP